MAVKTCLLLSAALSCLVLASAQQDIQFMDPSQLVDPATWLGAPQSAQLDQLTAQAAGSKPCVRDFRRSAAYIRGSKDPVKDYYYPDQELTTCAELCPVVDRVDEWAKATNYTGRQFTLGKGWTANDIGNGPSGTVPTDDMYKSLVVNKVFGLCLVVGVNPDNTKITYYGTEATATLVMDVPGVGDNGTVIHGCLFVDKFGGARMSLGIDNVYTLCGCQRMCKPRVKGCIQQMFWGGKSCGSCSMENAIGVKEAGCGCRVKKWGAFWAGWYNKDDGKCYANVVTAGDVATLPPPTDYMREPSCPQVCPKV